MLDNINERYERYRQWSELIGILEDARKEILAARWEHYRYFDYGNKIIYVRTWNYEYFWGLDWDDALLGIIITVIGRDESDGKEKDSEMELYCHKYDPLDKIAKIIMSWCGNWDEPSQIEHVSLRDL